MNRPVICKLPTLHHLAAWMLLCVACDSVSSSSIQRWRTTEKGPRKLENALNDRKVAPKLRAEAALALMEIGKPEAAEQALAGMSVDERAAVGGELVSLYAGVIENGPVTQARDARDGLFVLREKLGPAAYARIDAALLPALAKDLRAGRVAGGRFPMERVLATLGPSAGPVLLQILEDPSAPYVAVVDVLSKVADPETRERAGTILAQRAAKQPTVPPQMWRALGMVGGRAATELLENNVEKGHERDAVLAAQALQQGPRRPALVTFAMRVAGDQRASKAVREEMFGLLEYIGTPEATEGAIRIIATDQNPLVRYRAYEAAIAIGQAEAIQPALEAFPATASHKREDVLDFLVKDIQKIGAPAQAALVKALSSRSPLTRMTALLALETLGTAAHAPEVAKLADDRANVRGFPGGSSVGREAARIAGILQSRPDGGKP